MKIGLVGFAGTGKSTVFQLLLRFYDTAAGEIRFDGVRVDAADPHELRGRIAMVPQDVAIFATSIKPYEVPTSADHLPTYEILIIKPVATMRTTLTSATREKRRVRYHWVALSRLTYRPTSMKGSPPIQKPVASSWIAVIAISGTRPSTREAS